MVAALPLQRGMTCCFLGFGLFLLFSVEALDIGNPITLYTSHPVCLVSHLIKLDWWPNYFASLLVCLVSHLIRLHVTAATFECWHYLSVSLYELKQQHLEVALNAHFKEAKDEMKQKKTIEARFEFILSLWFMPKCAWNKDLSRTGQPFKS